MCLLITYFSISKYISLYSMTLLSTHHNWLTKLYSQTAYMRTQFPQRSWNHVSHHTFQKGFIANMSEKFVLHSHNFYISTVGHQANMFTKPANQLDEFMLLTFLYACLVNAMLIYSNVLSQMEKIYCMNRVSWLNPLCITNVQVCYKLEETFPRNI